MKVKSNIDFIGGIWPYSGCDRLARFGAVEISDIPGMERSYRRFQPALSGRRELVSVDGAASPDRIGRLSPRSPINRLVSTAGSAAPALGESPSREKI